MLRKLNKFLLKRSSIITISILTIITTAIAIIFTDVHLYIKAFLALGFIIAAIRLLQLTIKRQNS